ncbi:AzlC family ABC transporter permease [Lipingzhangella sp. LS1_29]|uniref:AzlC family ABC transporter permease n=1 Tax=Lipingzhangella rawalii TaxID=2055835 RepID=A0ABU2H266_9ACTN|nr:AzlC family ABC transporter permease [Lipingzhangella rawalii]MDS1269378.1 AzlC family ABC transporter permease [Lipingzhangella rawalii]
MSVFLRGVAGLSAPTRNGLGVGIAAGLSGLAFGTAAVAAGFSVAQSSVLSLLAFTGASQFALVGVAAGGGNLAVGAVGALLLGSRNTLYGLRLSHVLGWRGLRRVFAAHGVIDESAAVALAQRSQAEARTGFLTTFVTTFVCWNTTTLIGALATERIGDTSAFGLDAAVPAVFLALLWSRLREGARERWVALGGAVIALAATPFLPPGVPILLASASALVATLIPARAPRPEGGTPDREVRS